MYGKGAYDDSHQFLRIFDVWLDQGCRAIEASRCNYFLALTHPAEHASVAEAVGSERWIPCTLKRSLAADREPKGKPHIYCLVVRLAALVSPEFRAVGCRRLFLCVI